MALSHRPRSLAWPLLTSIALVLLGCSGDPEGSGADALGASGSGEDGSSADDGAASTPSSSSSDAAAGANGDDATGGTTSASASATGGAVSLEGTGGTVNDAMGGTPSDTGTGGTPIVDETGGTSGAATGGTTVDGGAGGTPNAATGGMTVDGGAGGTPNAATGGSVVDPVTGGTGGAVVEPVAQRSDVAFDQTPDIGDDEYAQFLANLSDFGFDVFDQLTSDDENLVFSPLSMGVALGMVYAGAGSNTATQMAAAMHHDLDDASLHAGYNRAALELQARNVAPNEAIGEERSLSTWLVNSAWAQHDYSLETSFLDVLSERYDSELWLVDFIQTPESSRMAINQWVLDETAQRIEELIPAGGVTAATRLVLVNALYFKAHWLSQFETAATNDAEFTTLDGEVTTVPMMTQSLSANYAAGENYQVVELPFIGSSVKLTLVLPDEGAFPSVRDALSSDWLAALDGEQLSQLPVTLEMPRFEFTWGTASLKPALQALGIVDAFDAGSADFTGMSATGDLFVSDIVQQAFIAVDEEGTEAAAATAAIMVGSGLPTDPPPPPIPVTLDRPFLFMIRDHANHLLFVGQVMAP